MAEGRILRPFPLPKKSFRMDPSRVHLARQHLLKPAAGAAGRKKARRITGGLLLLNLAPTYFRGSLRIDYHRRRRA